MCVAGKNTGAIRHWAMSTKVDTSRFRWRATSISGLWPDTLSATRCAPISSCERRNGGGQTSGNAVILWIALSEEGEDPRTLLGTQGSKSFRRSRRGPGPGFPRYHQGHRRLSQGPDIMPGVRVGHLVTKIAGGDHQGRLGRGTLPRAVTNCHLIFPTQNPHG